MKVCRTVLGRIMSIAQWWFWKEDQSEGTLLLFGIISKTPCCLGTLQDGIPRHFLHQVQQQHPVMRGMRGGGGDGFRPPFRGPHHFPLDVPNGKNQLEPLKRPAGKWFTDRSVNTMQSGMWRGGQGRIWSVLLFLFFLNFPSEIMFC